MDFDHLVAALAICIFFAAAASAPAAEPALSITIESGETPRHNSPVVATLVVGQGITAAQAKALSDAQHLTLQGTAGQPITAQAIRELNADGQAQALALYWIQPKLAPGEKATYHVAPAPTAATTQRSFSFKNSDKARDLYLGDQPVWQHAAIAYDPADHFNTYKHFHHVYGFHGEGVITNGPPYPEGAKIQFPHHRGLYIGYSKTKQGNNSYDTWHCTKGVANRHKEYVAEQEFAGPVAARAVSIAEWGDEKNTVVRERRELTTWNVSPDSNAASGMLVMDFTFTLEAMGGDVQLDGDPQHAGFQFRAHNDVNASKAKYLRPSSATGGKGDVWEDCRWVTAQFKVQGHPYAVMHMNHADNPKCVYSTRDYARFGSYFPTDLKQGEPLVLRYRVIVVDPEKQKLATVEDFDKLFQDYTRPVKVSEAK